MKNILVFDSGIGGEAVAAELRKLLPSAVITSINDREHMPYGDHTADEIFQLTQNALAPYIKKGFSTIVVACNTATTNAIGKLRLTYPDVNFIGIEPMVKPASQLSTTECIAVCATPSTLRSARYNELKNQWLRGFTVFEPDCKDWAELIEEHRDGEINIEELVRTLMRKDVDVIVLGCTHYHWLKARIVKLLPEDVRLLEPSNAIAQRIIEIIK